MQEDQMQATRDLLESAGVKPEKSMSQTGVIVDEVLRTPEMVALDEEDANDEEDEEESNQDLEEDDQDDDDQSDEDRNDDKDESNDEFEDEPAQKEQQQPATSLVQKGKDKYAGHLHETDMRVDPPLLEEGKKSIAEAEKVLEEQKTTYDKFKKVA